MSVVGSEFFKTLVDIGQNQIPLFVSKILEFLNTPVVDFFNVFRINVGIFTSGRPNFLRDLFFVIIDGGRDIGVQILKIFGFDLTLPMWQFILLNIGLILAISIVLRLLSIIL